MIDPAVMEPTEAAGRTRLGAYSICADEHGRILLARLSALEVDVGAWTLPGGGIEFGEHPDVAAIRELREESGLDGEIEEVAGIFSCLVRPGGSRRDPARRACRVRRRVGLSAPEPMRSTVSVEVAAPAQLVFRLARDVERWPRLLPHYVRIKAVERGTDETIVAEMVARRPLVPVLGLGLPVAWRSLAEALAQDESATGSTANQRT